MSVEYRLHLEVEGLRCSRDHVRSQKGKRLVALVGRRSAAQVVAARSPKHHKERPFCLCRKNFKLAVDFVTKCS